VVAALLDSVGHATVTQHASDAGLRGVLGLGVRRVVSIANLKGRLYEKMPLARACMRNCTRADATAF
jgi:hypothetical protein